MESFERTESRGRKALAWGTGVMLVFSFMAGITTYLTHIGAEQYGTEHRFGELAATGLGAVAVGGLLLMLFGFVELALASRREHHAGT